MRNRLARHDGRLVTVVAGLVAALFVAASVAFLPEVGAQASDKGAMSAERKAVYAEIESMFGFVPGFIQAMPDNSLALEWKTLKAVQMDPGPIPNKYRELIGLAVAAARGCDYCTYFHMQFAKLNGATDAELEDAVHYAKSNMGWSTYLHGIRYDMGQFQKDVDSICAHVKGAQAEKR